MIPSRIEITAKCYKTFVWNVILFLNYAFDLSIVAQSSKIHMTKITDSGYLAHISATWDVHSRRECVGICGQLSDCLAVSITENGINDLTCSTSSSLDWITGHNAATLYQRIGE